MQAKHLIIRDFGDSSKLLLEEFEFNDQLLPTEVLIEVHYSGVNFADIIMRQGLYQDAPKKPFVPGYEISGVVIAVGSDVKNLKVGDSVYSGTRFGGYCSHLKMNETLVRKIPTNWTLDLAAAMPVTYFTAHLALNEFGRVRSSDKILFETATGGVGVIAIQMAKQIGCEVYGLTTSQSKIKFLENFGIKAYLKSDFEADKSITGFDFILNSSAGNSMKIQYDRLNKSGKIVCIGVQDGIKSGKRDWIHFIKTIISSPRYPIVKLVMQSKMVSGFNALKFFDDPVWMNRLLPLLDNPPIKPVIGEIVPATDAARAHDLLEQKATKGKVLISWKN